MLSESIFVMVFQALVYGTAAISSCVVKLALLIANFAALTTHLQKLDV